MIDQSRRHKVKDIAEERKGEESKKEEVQLGSEADILKMQIDPTKVNIADIRRYEKLMSGKAVKALSNANVMLGAEMSDATK